jgi:hypothetical protein
MSLTEKLRDLAGSVGLAATDAPDRYATWSSWTYETHMADLKELWAEIREQLVRDHVKIEFIDNKLREMFDSFERGENDKGRSAAWAVYNIGVKDLR